MSFDTVTCSMFGLHVNIIQESMETTGFFTDYQRTSNSHKIQWKLLQTAVICFDVCVRVRVCARAHVSVCVHVHVCVCVCVCVWCSCVCHHSYSQSYLQFSLILIGNYNGNTFSRVLLLSISSPIYHSSSSLSS